MRLVLPLLLALSALAQTPLAQTPSVKLPLATVGVKVERGWAVAQSGPRRIVVYNLQEPGTFGRNIDIAAADFDVRSVYVLDYSVAPDDVLYVSAFVNFGLGERRYTLLRYDLRQKDAPQLRQLPDVRCPHLAAGQHGVWCVDPAPRAPRGEETKTQPPMVHWIAWLGAVRSYPLTMEGATTLGDPRVIAGENDRAVVWWSVCRMVYDVEPERGIVETSPIAVFGRGRAITSFALAHDGRVHALLPLRADGDETLTTTYALAELDAKRKSWRRLRRDAEFVRGARLAGWSVGKLWIWNRRGHTVQVVDGVVE